MDFVANRAAQIKKMLALIGVTSIEELFTAIPPELLCEAPSVDDGMSEQEGLLHMEALAASNSYTEFDSYLGAGAYDHYVPAIVGAICRKSEFLTAYTPYQAEASQGLLQALFEFQSAICALTGLDVTNGSAYDGASACAEALLMAVRAKPSRNSVAIAASLHPHYRSVIEQYLSGLGISLRVIGFHRDGTLDIADLAHQVDNDVAAVLLPYPNFFGVIDDIKGAIKLAHEASALAAVVATPIAYGLFASAGELGADIAVGDCQPLGASLQFGGPYAGYLACRTPLMRQMPGRIVGETLDVQGMRSYVLTLQAREQHIRREKATSNICTNQALVALASLVTMLWYGKEGLKKLALTNFQRTAYLRSELEKVPGVVITSGKNHFNEFVVKFSYPEDFVEKHFRSQGIIPGLALKNYFPETEGSWLVAVTEKKSLEQLKKFSHTAYTLGEKGFNENSL